MLCRITTTVRRVNDKLVSAVQIEQFDGGSSNDTPSPEGAELPSPDVVGQVILRLLNDDGGNLVPEVRLRTVAEGVFVEMQPPIFAMLDDGNVALTTVALRDADLAGRTLWCGVVLDAAQRALLLERLGNVVAEIGGAVEHTFPSFQRAHSTPDDGSEEADEPPTNRPEGASQARDATPGNPDPSESPPQQEGATEGDSSPAHAGAAAPGDEPPVNEPPA